MVRLVFFILLIFILLLLGFYVFQTGGRYPHLVRRVLNVTLWLSVLLVVLLVFRRIL